MRVERAAASGSVVSAILASACCIGPLVLAVLGISGAAFVLRFEPFRPYLLVATYGLLAGAFYFTYRPGRAACGPDGACDTPGTSGFGKPMLWIAAVVVVLATTFPWYVQYLPL